MFEFRVAGDALVCGKTEAQDYADVLNGIIYDCWKDHGFQRGWRNTIAVDLTVAAHTIGFDPEDVLMKLVDKGVIDLDDDDEDTYQRVKTVLDYKRNFSFDYMIDWDIFKDIWYEHRHEAENMPVIFVVE